MKKDKKARLEQAGWTVGSVREFLDLSRVAKMEAGDPTVSIDLLVRSFLAMGATQKELARVIGDRTG